MNDLFRSSFQLILDVLKHNRAQCIFYSFKFQVLRLVRGSRFFKIKTQISQIFTDSFFELNTEPCSFESFLTQKSFQFFKSLLIRETRVPF